MTQQLTSEEIEEIITLLKESSVFRDCQNEDLLGLVPKLQKKIFRKGEKLIEQGRRVHNMYLISSGSIIQLKKQGFQIHQISENSKYYNTINSLNVFHKERAFATVEASSDVLVTYVLDSASLLNELEKNPRFARDVISSLSFEVHLLKDVFKTPLLEQQSKQIPYGFVSIAGTIETFYRSALMSLLNARILGQRLPAKWFPNIHIQLPTRVAYIIGYKSSRILLADFAPPPEEKNNLLRIGLMFAPGVMMTPIASFLEACFAVKNPAPIYKKWIHGFLPRGVREIIFGMGLNQLSDYFEERVPLDNPLFKSIVGSMAAGILAGYLSQFPHNISTVKINDPSKSYRQHFRLFTKTWHQKFNNLPRQIRPVSLFIRLLLCFVLKWFYIYFPMFRLLLQLWPLFFQKE
eukprot:TRINITY_DN3715_c0_g1_i2.p1 TRINITY_DN3715_c0_g1~~TRINITY_DN3715_c0_g1_i2.p1  ORF type:complete len:406 (-),score=35.51 TRINITY_DN3715_c0_g1_i2:347-1564(-)